MKFLHFVLVLTLALALVPPATAGEETVELEAWYALYVGPSKVGWTMQRIVRFEADDGAPRWRNETKTHMRLQRAGMELVSTEDGFTIEDAAGQVLEFGKTANLGTGPTKTAGRLVDGQLEITVAGRTQTVAYPAGAVGPVRMNTLLEEQGIREGTVLEGKVFHADQPAQGIDLKIVVGKQEDIDLFGRKKRLWRTTATMSILPNPQTIWIDDNDETWASELDLPMLGTMRTLRTEEALAKTDLEPTEVFFNSLIVPEGTIDAPRKSTRALYRVAGKSLESAFVDGPGQRVLERGDGWALVEVVVPPDPEAPFEPPYEIAEGFESYLAGNSLLEIEDEAIRELAAKAPAGAGNAVDLARWIEGFVQTHIDDKSFGVGFGTAAEVARAREGDCTEHGVLCAALARALGLPSRVVMGLAYLDTRKAEKIEADGVFGYHMWTEVLVGPDTWMPIDAALDGMDATHLAMARSDLASVSPLADLMFPILGAMSDLEIEVVETGAKVAVPPDATPGDGG